MEPTLLHTLNADVQSLLCERLLAGTVAQLGRYPLYLLQHRINDKTVESTWVCLGADPKASLLNVISHLVSACEDLPVGFITAFLADYAVGSTLDNLLAKRPALTAEMNRLIDLICPTSREVDHPLDLPHRYLLTDLILGRPKYIYALAADLSHLDTIMTNAHQILHPLLEVEDLVEILNVHQKSNSVSFQPLNNFGLKYF